MEILKFTTSVVIIVSAANSEANAKRMLYVEGCFGSAGQVCVFIFVTLSYTPA